MHLHTSCLVTLQQFKVSARYKWKQMYLRLRGEKRGQFCGFLGCVIVITKPNQHSTGLRIIYSVLEGIQNTHHLHQLKPIGQYSKWTRYHMCQHCKQYRPINWFHMTCSGWIQTAKVLSLKTCKKIKWKFVTASLPPASVWLLAERSVCHMHSI